LISSRPLKIYHPSAIIATYVTTIVLMNTAPIALYMYGYNKYFINLMNVRQKSASRSQASSINGAQSEYSEYRRRSSPKLPQARLCCDGYAPHIFAIVLLVLIVAAKAPTIYAHMVIYQVQVFTLFHQRLYVFEFPSPSSDNLKTRTFFFHHL
uniref:G_PROTEIN_RECEP_F1_2 domain-containing protein n=1 Tax=Gongylonema pulchrum TaxID=637853 RepID=A0A183D5Y1_9BILA